MEIPPTGWIAIITIFVTIVLAILNKCWDPIAAHVGYPYGVDRSLEELREKVQQLSDLRIDLLHVDPLPSTMERRGWLGKVEALLKKEEEMKHRLDKDGLSYLKMCKLGREVEMELKKASDLITKGDRLVPKVKTSLTRRVDRSLPKVETSRHLDQLEGQSTQGVRLVQKVKTSLTRLVGRSLPEVELVPKEKTSLTRRVDRSLPEVEASRHPDQPEGQSVSNQLPEMQNPNDKVLHFPGMHNPYDKVLNFIKDRPEMRCVDGDEESKDVAVPADLGLVQVAKERKSQVEARGREGGGSFKKNKKKFIKDDGPGSVIMGIWGMGGVGKTTLINLVHGSPELEYNDYFSEVVLVQAGKGCTEVADLQKAIAIRMELHQIDDKISQAEIIRRHLQNKNLLLLVDDLWKDLDLEEVGIPSLQPQASVFPAKEKEKRPGVLHRRKVVFTTRSMDVCTSMGCGPENTIQMKCLNEEDAWKLFEKNVGNAEINKGEMHEFAKKIVGECRGLPMALCTIGKFMSPKVDPSEWRTASDLLKKSELHDITDSHEDLFKRLKESYDILREDMQKRFLVCSLWPENGNISMKILTRWWTGLGLLDGCNASDRGYTLINDLVHLSLLEKGDTGLDSTENSHVKMHNMIRMMAIGIVNEHGYKNQWLPNSSYRSALSEDKWHTVEKAWVSQEDTSRWCRWSSKVYFPCLKMLVARHLFSLNLMVRYFGTITFLDLEGMRRGGFPLEICKLTNLQHLNLSATRIEVLPLDLIKLIYLKYLYVRNNRYLQTIPEGLILALKTLKGLDLFSTGASFLNVLKELASFAEDLHMLGFTVRTTTEITQLGQLKRVCTQALCMHHFEDDKRPATINLQLLSNLTELRELAIVTSSHIEVLVAEAGPKLLSCLEIFELKNLLKLEKVTWKNAGRDIRVVSIYKCDKLKDVTWVRHLELLEQLTVTSCKEIERLIKIGESLQSEIVEDLPNVNQMVAISFPKLKKLKLEDLPKLSMISQQACEFEQLSYICVTRCDNIKDIRNQKYKQSMVMIKCSEDWWNGDSLGFIPCLIPIFCS